MTRSAIQKAVAFLQRPAIRKTVTGVIASATYVGMGEAGYSPGVATGVGIDAEQVRVLASGVCAALAYVLPNGIAATFRQLPAILGKDAADKFAVLSARVDKLEKRLEALNAAAAAAAEPKVAK